MTFGRLGVFGTGFGRFGSRPAYSFSNSEAATIVAAMTVAPSAPRRHQIDNLVGSLKAAGVWTLLDVFYVFAAHTSQAALLNWKNPGTLNATAQGTTTFTADRGFAGNGTSGYIATGYIPSSAGLGLTQDNAHYAARSLSDAAAATSNRLLGNGTSTTPRSTLLPRNTSDLFNGIVNDTTNASLANTSTLGQFIARRSASNARAFFRNAVSLGSSSTASTGLPTTEVVFLKDTTNFSSLQVASGSVGQSLSDQNITDYYAAELAYMQAVGAA